MLDIKLLRDDIEACAKRLLDIRGFKLDCKKFTSLEERRKTLQVETESLQQQRNTRSKSIGEAKSRGEDIAPLLKEVQNLGDELEQKKTLLNDLLTEMEDFLLGLPNLPQDDVPKGLSEDENVELRRFGEPKIFDFTPLPHEVFAEKLGQMDFATAAKITGSRFVVLKGALSKLHRALSQFMLDVHTEEHGYQEVYVPFIVHRDSLTGTSQLPKFADDLFKLEGEHPYYLIPTGEVPVANMVRDQIVDAKQLPLKMVSHTPCFRSEAGSYGKDTKGMIRQHQFEKVELIWVTKAEDSNAAHEQLTKDAEKILQKLALPYRVVSLCGGDLGFASSKTYDIEVWLPSQNTFREISSCSNCDTFQARRMQTRYKMAGEKDTQFAHTLNGSGLAVGRTLVAILENYQDADGQLHIPDVLQPYMGGQTLIK